jgi:predicted unusual protein kinase regulating ubiquinone biosynthesis (AarF/ABC1/UbiB family)
MVPVPELPRRAASRSIKLATLPLGFAGRTAVGLGKRVGGRPAEMVTAEIQQRTAEQVFRVLGELKGGAMKFGQAMSIFEAALPDELAAPYRDTLTKLQDAAPPMPAATVHKVLAESFGRLWRRRFESFDDTPAAAASIGQVHRAVWKDGTSVAVKIQYPGAAQALTADLNQVARMARMIGAIVPGVDVRALVGELKERMAEELDYTLERTSQEAFAAAYEGDPRVAVPGVIAGTDKVLVTTWMEGRPVSEIITSGTKAERDLVGST